MRSRAFRHHQRGDPRYVLQSAETISCYTPTTHNPLTTADRIKIDDYVPKDPNSKVITSLRSAMHQIRECTRALRQMDIPWDTSDRKALEKFVNDFEAIRVKVRRVLST